MFAKNQRLTIKITDLGKQGEGIGKTDGFTFFVEDALPGDEIEMLVVKLKKSYGYGKLMKILTPSPMRIEPKCPVFSKCGGCTLQHLDYPSQLAFKSKQVSDNLQRIGGFGNLIVEDIIGMDSPFFYRNKAQFPVREQNGEIVIGFFAARSHRTIPIDECAIQHPVNTKIIAAVKEFMKKNHIRPYNEEAHIGTIRHLVTRVGVETGEIMVCLVTTSDKIDNTEELVNSLAKIEGMTSISLNVNKDKTNVIFGRRTKTIWGKAYITDIIGGIKFNISPLSFFQVNPVQTKILYQKAVEFANAGINDTVIDAYCGIGTISLFFAEKAKKVIGIEIVPQAIEDATRNAALNHIDNTQFIVGEAESIISLLLEDQHSQADIIVIDPPRKGCDPSFIQKLLEMKPDKIVYVSCDPASLARDLKILCETHYQIGKVQAVDMFPQTMHVETCVLLSHKDPQTSPPSL